MTFIRPSNWKQQTLRNYVALSSQQLITRLYEVFEMYERNRNGPSMVQQWSRFGNRSDVSSNTEPNLNKTSIGLFLNGRFTILLRDFNSLHVMVLRDHRTVKELSLE